MDKPMLGIRATGRQSNADTKPLSEIFSEAINVTPLFYSRTRAISVALVAGVLTALFHGSQLLWDIAFFTIFSTALCYDASLLWRLLMIATRGGRQIENVEQNAAGVGICLCGHRDAERYTNHMKSNVSKLCLLALGKANESFRH